jgi:hypothetical protein
MCHVGRVVDIFLRLFSYSLRPVFVRLQFNDSHRFTSYQFYEVTI